MVTDGDDVSNFRLVFDVYVIDAKRTTVIIVSRITFCYFVDHLVVVRPLAMSRDIFSSSFHMGNMDM